MIAMALAAAIASAPMGVSAPAMVRGDGRTPAVVDVIGPAPLEAEDPRFPDGGSISCTGAPALSAGQTLPPGILAPATATTGQLACIARRRGAEAAFSLRVEPPGPGLYAAVLPAENGGMALRPFRLQPGGSSIAAYRPGPGGSTRSENAASAPRRRAMQASCPVVAVAGARMRGGRI